MKIVVVGARGIPNVEGGAEKNAEKIFPLIAAMGHEVTLFGLKGMGAEGSFRGVRLIKAPHVRVLGTDKLAYYLYAFLRTLAIRPDVVHLQGLGAGILGFAYRAMGYRVVVRYGSADYILAKWGLLGRMGFRFAERQLRLAHAVIAVTPALRDRLAERGIVSNVHVVHNALDDPDPEPDRRHVERLGLTGRRFVLSVGRVTSQKNFLLLVRAFRAARERGVDLDRLVIVGGLEEQAYVEKVRAQADDAVVLTGRLPRDELSGLLADCTAFVNSSIHEGHSNSVMEAISYSCPLLVSDIAENADLPLAKHNFFRSDDVEALTQSLADLAADPERYVVPKSAFMDWHGVAAETVAIQAGSRVPDSTAASVGSAS